MTPLIWAAEFGHVDVGKTLLFMVPTSTERRATALLHSMRHVAMAMLP